MFTELHIYSSVAEAKRYSKETDKERNIKRVSKCQALVGNGTTWIYLHLPIEADDIA